MPRASGLRLTAIALCLAAAPQPVLAQTVEDLDRLIDAGNKPDDGVKLAETQGAGQARLDSLATLERVLAIDPKHKRARFLHAATLCMLDDREGAAVELNRLKKGDYKKQDWSQLQELCAIPKEPAR